MSDPHSRRKPCTVIMVLPYSPLERLAGLEFATISAARSLANADLTIEILSVGRSGQVAGVSVRGCGAGGGLALRLILSRAQVVHFMEIWPSPRQRWLQILAGLILKLRGTAVTTTVATYGNITHRTGGKLGARLWGWINTIIVGLNPDQRAELVARSVSPQKFRVCPRGVPAVFRPATFQERHQARESLAIDHDRTVVLFLGRFVKRKRPVEIALAWERDLRLMDRSLLLFVGTGAGNDDSVEDNLRAVVMRNRNCMDIRPWTDEPLRFLHASDIFVLPSEREGQPNALLQAMACGLAVVVCSSPGLSYVVEHGVTGLTAETPELVLQAIHTLANNSALRIGVGARASTRVSQFHNMDLVRQFHLELYREMLREL